MLYASVGGIMHGDGKGTRSDGQGATYLALGIVGAGVLGGGNGEAIALRRLFSASVMLALFSKVDERCAGRCLGKARSERMICALLNVFLPFLLLIRFLGRCRPKYRCRGLQIETCMMGIIRFLSKNL